jgi:hypothetical protein
MTALTFAVPIGAPNVREGLLKAPYHPLIAQPAFFT